MTLEQATRKALDALEPIHHGNMTPMAENAWKTATAALREALEGQPAQAAEPVAYLTRNAEGDPAMLFFDKDEASTYCEDWVDPEPLLTPHQLTQAQAGAVPLTDKQIRAMAREYPAEDLCGWSYRMGVADTESHHGIKGGQS